MRIVRELLLSEKEIFRYHKYPWRREKNISSVIIFSHGDSL